jgi:hypothetical protein
MRRPLPIIPRGPRRAARPRPTRVLWACPRVACDWELGALRALMKPQTRGAILNRPALQPWSGRSRQVLQESVREVAARMQFSPEIHFPAHGDYLFACNVDHAELEDVKGLALLVSTRLPDVWFVLGRLYLKGGLFHRRRFGWKLQLVRAADVHLTRPVRAALRDLLR